jgi:hypothetical protein
MNCSDDRRPAKSPTQNWQRLRKALQFRRQTEPESGRRLNSAKDWQNKEVDVIATTSDMPSHL